MNWKNDNHLVPDERRIQSQAKKSIGERSVLIMRHVSVVIVTQPQISRKPTSLEAMVSILWRARMMAPFFIWEDGHSEYCTCTERG